MITAMAPQTGLKRYQSFTTTIADDRIGMQAAFAVYPARQLSSQLAEELLSSSHFDDVDLIRPGSGDVRAAMVLALTGYRDADPAPEVADFVEYLFSEPLVPYRSSPITGQAISDLVAKTESGPPVLRAGVIGLVAYAHGDPMLILFVAGAIIAFGAASGLAGGLHSGLHDFVVALIARYTPEDAVGPNMDGVDLRRQDLAGEDFRGASLRFAHLEHADLRGADFFQATLSSTYLDWAHLTDANLTEVHLRGARLHGADLTGARLERADLTGALFDDATIWPAGFDPVEAGARRVDFPSRASIRPASDSAA